MLKLNLEVRVSEQKHRAEIYAGALQHWQEHYFCEGAQENILRCEQGYRLHAGHAERLQEIMNRI